MKSRIIYLLLLILGLYLVVSLTRSTWQFYQKQDIFKKAEGKVRKEEERNKKLTQELSQVRSLSFIEEQVRNKLNLAKPQETVVVVSKELIGKMATYSGEIKSVGQKEPNWKKWWKLFF